MASRLGQWRATYQGMACPRCHRNLRHETLRSGQQSCPSCNGLFEAVRFDPVEARVVVPDLAGTGPEGSAPCTRHARNQAEVACARCGQFMCSLCRIDADQKTYCPSCFERLSAEGSLASAVTRVRNWAGWAVLCLVGSFFTYFLPAPVLAPLGMYFCVRGLKDKRSRGETDGIVRLYLLMILCLMVFVGGLLFYVALFGAFAFKGAD
jgi:uncharacterized paraquat-inducible protein A